MPAPGPGQVGGRIGDVIPSAEAVTLRQHHSFIELPDANYKPRAFDPRAGYFGVNFLDFAAPMGTTIASATSTGIACRRTIRRPR